MGTTANPSDSGSYQVLPLAESEGVAESVREVPRRLLYHEALSVMARSDANLMIGSNEPHYTASKIFPCLMAGRPYLSVFHRASSSHEILASSGGGLALAFRGSDDLDALEGPIADGLRKLVEDPGSLGRADPRAFAAYEASAIARRYADIFAAL